MYDDLNLHRYGTPLPELEEDAARPRPIRPEDQIVTDENGKRRFHGAFTGGFSAGYWNTVGSEAGWTPKSFKSSRKEKSAHNIKQRPEDFMDDEDRGEFGIAPERLQMRPQYAQKDLKEHERHVTSYVGPIPGQPALEELLKLRQDKIGVRILKSMGWRPGQGIGPRQTRKEKQQAKARNNREMYVMQQYGYKPEKDPSRLQSSSRGVEEEEVDESLTSEDEYNDEITFAPDDYDPFICKPKTDRFGLGYNEHLSRDPVLSQGLNKNSQHINLFEVLDKNNKKVTIVGKAFGVGALEDEDEDIYNYDDMSKYDFSLEDNKPKKKKIKEAVNQDRLVINGFETSKIVKRSPKDYAVDIPDNYIPRNWNERKSRFEPMDPQRAYNLEKQFNHCKVERQNLSPSKRAQLIEESVNKNINASSNAQLQKKQHTVNFRVDGGYSVPVWSNSNITSPSPCKKPSLCEATKLSCSTDADIFKPFIYDESKQRRYEEFLKADVKSEDEISNLLNTIQPIYLCDWERDREKQEFMQAKKMFKPLDGQLSERFISEAACPVNRNQSVTCIDTSKPLSVERTKFMWRPCGVLYKRYNIPEPCSGLNEEQRHQKPKAKLSVFDYMEESLNKKADFQTPQIVPNKRKTPVNRSISPTSMIPCPKPISAKLVDSHAPPKCVKLDTKKSRCKTDLQKRVEECKDKPGWEKIELFKQIFVDSSDDESDEKNHASKCQSGNDLPEIVPANVKCVNTCRNDSPPRGIFASLLSDSMINAKDKDKLKYKIGSHSETIVPNECSTQTNSDSDKSFYFETTHICQLEPKKIKSGNMSQESSDSILITIPSAKIIFTARQNRLCGAGEFENEDENKAETQVQAEIPEAYGPQIPENLTKYKELENLPSTSKLSTNRKREPSNASDDDEWVEKKFKASKNRVSWDDDKNDYDDNISKSQKKEKDPLSEKIQKKLMHLITKQREAEKREHSPSTSKDVVDLLSKKIEKKLIKMMAKQTAELNKDKHKDEWVERPSRTSYNDEFGKTRDISVHGESSCDSFRKWNKNHKKRSKHRDNEDNEKRGNKKSKKSHKKRKRDH